MLFTSVSSAASFTGDCTLTGARLLGVFHISSSTDKSNGGIAAG